MPLQELIMLRWQPRQPMHEPPSHWYKVDQSQQKKARCYRLSLNGRHAGRPHGGVEVPEQGEYHLRLVL